MSEERVQKPSNSGPEAPSRGSVTDRLKRRWARATMPDRDGASVLQRLYVSESGLLWTARFPGVRPHRLRSALADLGPSPRLVPVAVLVLAAASMFLLVDVWISLAGVPAGSSTTLTGGAPTYNAAINGTAFVLVCSVWVWHSRLTERLSAYVEGSSGLERIRSLRRGAAARVIWTGFLLASATTLLPDALGFNAELVFTTWRPWLFTQVATWTIYGTLLFFVVGMLLVELSLSNYLLDLSIDRIADVNDATVDSKTMSLASAHYGTAIGFTLASVGLFIAFAIFSARGEFPGGILMSVLSLPFYAWFVAELLVLPLMGQHRKLATARSRARAPLDARIVKQLATLDVATDGDLIPFAELERAARMLDTLHPVWPVSLFQARLALVSALAGFAPLPAQLIFYWVTEH